MLGAQVGQLAEDSLELIGRLDARSPTSHKVRGQGRLHPFGQEPAQAEQPSDTNEHVKGRADHPGERVDLRPPDDSGERQHGDEHEIRGGCREKRPPGESPDPAAVLAVCELLFQPLGERRRRQVRALADDLVLNPFEHAVDRGALHAGTVTEGLGEAVHQRPLSEHTAVLFGAQRHELIRAVTRQPGSEQVRNRRLARAEPADKPDRCRRGHRLDDGDELPGNVIVPERIMVRIGDRLVGDEPDWLGRHAIPLHERGGADPRQCWTG